MSEVNDEMVSEVLVRGEVIGVNIAPGVVKGGAYKVKSNRLISVPGPNGRPGFYNQFYVKFEGEPKWKVGDMCAMWCTFTKFYSTETKQASTAFWFLKEAKPPKDKKFERQSIAKIQGEVVGFTENGIKVKTTLASLSTRGAATIEVRFKIFGYQTPENNKFQPEVGDMISVWCDVWLNFAQGVSYCYFIYQNQVK